MRATFLGAQVDVKTIVESKGWSKEFGILGLRDIEKALEILIDKPYLAIALPSKNSDFESKEIKPLEREEIHAGISKIEIKVTYEEI